MPIPGASVRTIGDLTVGIVNALQQRTDVASIAPFYARKAIIEVTENNPFEELRRTGPQVKVSTSQNNVAAFLNGDDDLNWVEVFTIFVDPPGNTVKDTLDYKTPKALEIITSPVTIGIPKYWTRFGTNFLFGPAPNTTYTMFVRYQVKHPMPDSLDAVSLSGQKLYIPDTWEEIIEYSAALRIAIVKRWNEQVDRLHTTLFGDPMFQSTGGKQGRPGLIAARLFQQERDSMFNTRQLGIRVGRYSAH